MTRDEILSAVREIFFDAKTNSVVSSLLDKLEDAMPNANINDLIFHNFKGLTPEQVVDEAFRREAAHASKSEQK